VRGRAETSLLLPPLWSACESSAALRSAPALPAPENSRKPFHFTPLFT
jgi:hypothetical protein